MSVRLCLIALLTQMIWLASCGPSDPALAVLAPKVQSALSEAMPAARRAAIKRQIAPACAEPLTDDELEWAAQFVEENRSKGAIWIAGRLLKMHRETKKCRGIS
jgi:hypothetical protein